MKYKFTFEDGSEAFLAHHGVKGMKWGVWNSETATRYGAKGGIMPKGTVLTRVATSPEDPTYFNKKHVSTNKKDHDEWIEYIGGGYSDRGVNTYDIVYATTKDIKVANAAQSGKMYVDKILSNPEYSEQAKMDEEHFKSNYMKIDKDLIKSNTQMAMSDIVSGHIAYQTKTGERIINELLLEGYGAVTDTHGRNTAKDPLIVLDPDSNLVKDSAYYGKYWSPFGQDLKPPEKKINR